MAMLAPAARPVRRSVAILALILVVWLAWQADVAWIERHFLPRPFCRWWWQVTAIVGVQVISGLLVLALGWYGWKPVRRRWQERDWAGPLLIGCAGLAAVASAELVLRTQAWRHTMANHMQREPQRVANPYLGWTHVAGHSGSDLIGGRTVAYRFDRHGFRIADRGGDIDPNAPSVLFAGESVMLGFGLEWDETIPAQVGSTLGVQAVNLAVTGYGTDQSFLRLRKELPQFTCPLAVVSIFMASFLDRNLNRDRPYLDARLVWHDQEIGWRVPARMQQLVAYRDSATIRNGAAMTVAVLRATQETARAKGADALVIVPVFQPEPAIERAIRTGIVDRAGVPNVVVPLEQDWRIAVDAHPDARADRAIAQAIVRRLDAGGMADRAARCPERRSR